MAMIFSGLGALFTGGGAAATGAAAGAAGGVSSGLSLSGLLQGLTSVAGVAATLGGAMAEADAAKAAAIDAEAEKDVEALQGIERRRQIKGALRDAIGAQDTAYAASGVDLSFGTARQARTDAAREADLALTADNTSQDVRAIRLDERARNYRRAAKRAMFAGFSSALTRGVDTFTRFKERY